MEKLKCVVETERHFTRTTRLLDHASHIREMFPEEYTSAMKSSSEGDPRRAAMVFHKLAMELTPNPIRPTRDEHNIWAAGQCAKEEFLKAAKKAAYQGDIEKACLHFAEAIFMVNEFCHKDLGSINEILIELQGTLNYLNASGTLQILRKEDIEF